MITICSLLWDPNRHSRDFSSMYTTEWVEKLYRGFARNLTRPFMFVCYTDRKRTFDEPIHQLQIKSPEPSYATCIEPFELSEHRPMILCGLDTVIVGNIDHLADSAVKRADLGLPRDPYNLHQACNGFCLIPSGFEQVAHEHRGQNDMEHVRSYPHSFLDDEFPGEVVSYKGHVEKGGLGDARVVYFHGLKKPHELQHLPWIREHWR